MKGTLERDILEHLAALFMSDGMKTNVAAAKALHPTETLDDLEAVYVNEEDYDQIITKPCLVLLAHGWEKLVEMTGGIEYDFRVDVIAVDDPDIATGLPGVHNRVATYLGCATDLLLSTHSYEAGYWDGAHPLEPVEPQNLIDERFGTLSRISGHRFGLRVTVGYP